ncbi:MAG: manganese efflux pump MntP family protein [Bacteroidales bacterium]|nr:manganese efflux pump MntP family protein [Bacteroidales bacterium]
MNILDIILLAIGLAMDCFAVSIACGMYMKKILSGPSFRIALFFGFFQAFMPLIGWLIGSSFRSYIENFDHWFAFIILIILGGKMIYENFKGKDSNKKHLNPYKWVVVLTMAIATSIDALAVGFTFSFLRIDLWLAIFIIGITSFFFSLFGLFFGHRYCHRVKIPAELFGGIVLIGIGTKILIEHLYF